MKVKFVAAVVGATLGLGVVGMAQAQKPEDQIKYRKAAFNLLSANFGPIVATAKGDRPFNAADVQRFADRADFIAKLPWDYFGAGSDKGDTRALPAIWSDQAKFKAAADAMQGEVAKLAQVAKGGDLAQIRSQVGAVGKACTACHDDFRRK